MLPSSPTRSSLSPPSSMRPLICDVLRFQPHHHAHAANPPLSHSLNPLLHPPPLHRVRPPLSPPSFPILPPRFSIDPPSSELVLLSDLPPLQAHQPAPPSSSPPACESSFVMCHVSKLTN